MNWRDDIENAHKDRPILMVNSGWENREFSRFTCRIVEWEEIPDNYGNGSGEYAWVYDYDYEWGYTRTIQNPKLWAEIANPFKK
jgi:hypothetical protein